MNKKELVDYLEEKKDYLDIMQKDFGHSSWWYSNRKSDHCIKCKVHAWLDSSKVLALLSEKERATVELLELDIDKMLNDVVWGEDYCFEWGMVGQARRDVLENLKEEYPEVVDITYQGKQGGWACIQYSFDINSGGSFYYTLDDLDCDDIKIKDMRELKKQVDKAIETINNVNSYYMKAYNELCNSISDPSSYVYDIKERIKSEEENLLAQLDNKIELSEKLKALK